MTRVIRHVAATMAALMLFVTAGSTHAAPTPLGAATPQAVVARVAKAAQTKDLSEIVACLEPESRHEITLGLLVATTMFVAFMGMGSELTKAAEGVGEAIAGQKMDAKEKAKLDKAAAASKAKMEKAKVELSAILKRHGLPNLLDEKAQLPEADKADALFKNVDEPALAADLLQFMSSIGESKDKSPSDDGPFPSLDDVKDYKIAGNKATAKAGKETIDFVKIDDRWFLRAPQKKSEK